MQHSRRAFSADDALPHDEIDDLFEKLQPVQPPPSLIQRILTSISQLPKPQLPEPEQEHTIDVQDHLVVRKESLPPS